MQINLYNQVKKKPLHEIMLYLFYLMIIASFFGVYLSFPSYQSIYLFRFVLYALALLFIIYYICKKKIVVNNFMYNYQMFLVIWLFISIISILWSRDFMLNLKYNYYLINNIILIFMCIHFLNNYNKLDRLFVLLLFVFLINIVIALIEISIGWHLKVIPEFYLNTWVTRAPYTFYDNINDTAGYFMLFLPLTFIPLSKTKKKRFIFFVIFILTSIIIIKTSSRVNYIVLLIQFLFFINIFLKGIKTHTSKYLVGVFLIIAIIILAIQIINGNVGEAQSKLVEEVSSLRGIFTADSGSLFVRRELMVESINILLNSSLLGVGAGNIERYISDANISYLEGTSNLHNWWFELLSNYGIFIFIAFVIFYLKLLSSLRKLSKNNQTKKGKIYAGSVFISILSFSLVSLGSSSIIQIRYMWILFGITLATINSIKIELSEKESEGNIYEDTSYY